MGGKRRKEVTKPGKDSKQLGVTRASEHVATSQLGDREVLFDTLAQIAVNEHPNMPIGVGEKRTTAKQHPKPIDDEQTVRRSQDNLSTRLQMLRTLLQEAIGIHDMFNHLARNNCV